MDGRTFMLLSRLESWVGPSRDVILDIGDGFGRHSGMRSA